VKEYISREAAIGRLDELERTAHHNSVLRPDHVEECREALRDFPAADVRPVVRGEWEEEDSASNRWSFRCSVCGKGGRGYKFNFCSNCGADMREANDV
jgi:ribosomal protein S14